MMKPIISVAVLFTSLAPALAADEPGPSAKEIEGAVVRAVPLIEKGSAGHMARRTCFACHNQALPMLALTTARSRGVAIHDEEVGKHLRFIAEFLGRNRDEYLKGHGQGGQADTAGYALWALEMGGYKPDRTTAAVAEYLLLRNKDIDHWRCSSRRPPSEVSHFTTTYLAVRGLQAFAPAEAKKRVAERVASARAWLEKTPPKDNEDRVFRLWAMQRAGCRARDIQAAARELLGRQHTDGGWGQTDTMQSDAYATGTALVALQQAGGLEVSDAAYRRGLKYLLSTQRPDGTWLVRSRSDPFQTYFESGFPHGKDQFISLAASGWATTALSLALPPQDRRSVAAPGDRQLREARK